MKVETMASITKTLALMTAGTLALTACAPLQDPNNPNRNTQTGALIGGIGGAVVGGQIGDSEEQRRRNAVVGALAGAGGGALVGNRLDQQEAALRAALGNQVGIQNTGNQLILTLPQDILFATDSATLRPDLQRDLRALAANLQQYPDTRVNVIGHTDNVGEAGYNQGLSERRARSVANTLINSGVSPSRISATGRGESQPVATNLTPEGRQQNRRVEVIITPI
ncbi:OmpA family protein [Aestuariibius sp. 2305UL40-4]|uniref:OmpA family protein n=1 Tax=Aestuariibius violaceus TaxID=3234132 RepID=UPI00345E8666